MDDSIEISRRKVLVVSVPSKSEVNLAAIVEKSPSIIHSPSHVAGDQRSLRECGPAGADWLYFGVYSRFEKVPQNANSRSVSRNHQDSFSVPCVMPLEVQKPKDCRWIARTRA